MVHSISSLEIQSILGLIKLSVLVLGLMITYFSTRAYQRTNHRSLGYLAGGFATITIGAVFGGITFEIINQPLIIGVLIEGIFFLLGFLLIAISLRVK